MGKWTVISALLAAAMSVMIICCARNTTFASLKNMNPLIEAERTDMRSGSAKWLKVSVGKETLKDVSEAQFSEFCSEVVKDSGYGWVTIVCGDGTGIQFPGSFPGAAEYGEIDRNGQIDEVEGYISLTKKGYVYADAD